MFQRFFRDFFRDFSEIFQIFFLLHWFSDMCHIFVQSDADCFQARFSDFFMMYWRWFGYVSEICLNKNHRFPINFNDISENIPELLCDWIREFRRFLDGSHGARWWGQRPSVIQLRAVIVSLRAVTGRPACGCNQPGFRYVRNEGVCPPPSWGMLICITVLCLGRPPSPSKNRYRYAKKQDCCAICLLREAKAAFLCNPFLFGSFCPILWRWLLCSGFGRFSALRAQSIPWENDAVDGGFDFRRKNPCQATATTHGGAPNN